jgi:LCP family protein required for cell wall assembly
VTEFYEEIDPADNRHPSNSRHMANKKTRHPVRIVLLSLLGLLTVAVIVAGAYGFNLANRFNSSTQKIQSAFPEESLRPAAAEGKDGKPAPVNVLLMGSDSRGASLEASNEGQSSDQRSDTLMLLHVPSDRKNIYVMSVMRDTWIEIPGRGQAKINAALPAGGVPLVVQTMEGLFGVRIDHVASMDFQGFESLTDAIGGVEIAVPYAFKSFHIPGKVFNKGNQLMDGKTALAFVRERFAFPDGDYQRVKNQQIFLKAVMSKMLTGGTLSNPATISEVVTEFSPFISVDKSLDAGAVAALGLQLKDVRTPNVKMFTLPNLGTGTSSDGQSIVLPDNAEIQKVSEALKSDAMESYVQSAVPAK